MTRAIAPLTSAGRLPLAQRCQAHSNAHVAAEAGVARACLSKWKIRYDRLGEAGMCDRASAPNTSPAQSAPEVTDRIEALRRETNGPPAGSRSSLPVSVT